MAIPSQLPDEELVRLAWLYAALAKIIRASTRTTDRRLLLEGVCQVLTDAGGFGLAWVAGLAPDGKQLIPEASSGRGQQANYPDHIAIYADDRDEGRGPSGVAFREGRVCICNDLLMDPALAPWHKAYQEHGFKASAALPIWVHGHVTVVLSVYATEVGYFGGKEIGLLEEAAAEISFSLENGENLEARKVADQLALQEQHFSSTLIEALPGVFYLISAQGRYLRWNQTYLDVSGYSAAEVRQMRPLDFFPSDQRARVARQIEQVFESGEAILDADLLTKDGRTASYLFTGKRVDINNEPCLVGMGINIEHQRQAEAALRESEEQNRGVLNSIRAQIAVLDRSGVITAVNDAWREFEEENRGPDGPVTPGIGANYLEVCRKASGTNADAAAAYAGLRDLLNGERDGLTLEYECSSPTVKRWSVMTATPLRRTGGGAVVSHSDISTRKQSEVLLKESNLRFKMLARATNDVVRDWDLQTNAVWWNEGYETLFGFSLDGNHFSIDSWRDRIHPDDRARVAADLQRLLASEESTWTAHYRFKRKDGDYSHIIDRGQVIRDAKGVALRMLAGMTDVSERVLLEERLRQAQRLEAVGQLTGGVAHDFNNLLTVILGNAEWLLEHKDDRSQREFLEIIVAAAKSAAELTEQLMAFARKQALNPISVDSNALLAQMTPLLQRSLGAQLKIDIVPAAELWLALVDPVQLESALLNLCINARDAVEANGRVRIETHNVILGAEFTGHSGEVKPGDYVLITVSDNGKGIAPEVLPRVFEPFFTTKEKGQGTGLGLAMVYGFVKQSGGHIAITSELGEGTVIKMYLPRALTSIPKTAETKESAQSIRGAETILLVEDQEQVRRLVARQLKSFGYRVLQARNAAAALEMLRRHEKIDLLFTDILMPGGISGRQLANTARQRQPDLKVLFTSGYTEDAVIHHGRLDPGVELLAKPYQRRDLGKKIRAILDTPGPTG